MIFSVKVWGDCGAVLADKNDAVAGSSIWEWKTSWRDVMLVA
jgi:hypothetical protein